MLDLTNLSGFGAGGRKRGGRTVLDPRFACSFACSSSLTTHWANISGTVLTTDDKRTGSHSLLVDFDESSNISMLTKHSIETSENIIVCRFYIKFETLPNQTKAIWWVGTGTGRLGVAFDSSDNSIRTFSSSSVTPATSGIIVTTGQWYKIDTLFDCTSATKTIDAKVNGVDIEQRTTGGTNTGGQFGLGYNSSSPNTATQFKFYIDDILASRNVSDYPLPEGYIVPFYLTADGTHNTQAAGTFEDHTATNITDSTTDSYTLVDDVTISDYIAQGIADTGAYVEHIYSPVAGNINPLIDPSSVHVIEGFTAHAVSSQQSVSRLYLNGSFSTIYDGNIGGTDGTEVPQFAHFIQSPASVNWRANFAGLITHRFGFSNDIFPEPRLTYSILEVSYED